MSEYEQQFIIATIFRGQKFMNFYGKYHNEFWLRGNPLGLNYLFIFRETSTSRKYSLYDATNGGSIFVLNGVFHNIRQ